MLMNLRKRGAKRKGPLMMVCFPLFSFHFFSSVRDFFCFDPLLSFFLAEDDDLVTPEVLADEAVTDPIVASEQEPRDSRVVLESSHGMIFFGFSPFCLSLPPLADMFLFSCQLTCQRIPTVLNHPWMQLLIMLLISSWRQRVLRWSSKVVNLDINF